MAPMAPLVTASLAARRSSARRIKSTPRAGMHAAKASAWPAANPALLHLKDPLGVERCDGIVNDARVDARLIEQPRTKLAATAPIQAEGGPHSLPSVVGL